MPPNNNNPMNKASLFGTARTALNIATNSPGKLAAQAGFSVFKQVASLIAPTVAAPARNLVEGRGDEPETDTGFQHSTGSAHKRTIRLSSGSLNTFLNDSISAVMSSYTVSDLKTPQAQKQCILHLNQALPIGTWTITVSGDNVRMNLTSFNRQNRVSFTYS